MTLPELRIKGFTLLFLLSISPFLLASESTPIETEKLLIKNVYLNSPDKENETLLVNLIIIDKKLDLVTQDEVKDEGMTKVLDAHKGFFLGNLKIGEPASFMILNENPGENSKVLLDTKKHLTFAISKGTIIKSSLDEFDKAAPVSDVKKKKPKQTGWLAYQPPPRQIPLSYKTGQRKWNTWDNDYFNGFFLGGLVLDRQKWLSQNNASEQQLGDLTTFNGGEIRALRFGVAGQLKFDTPWVYVIAGATNAFDKGFETENLEEVSFFDWRLDIPLTRKNTLSIGKQKEPVSMERLMTLLDSPMQERSASGDALLPARNVGLVLSGYGFNQRTSWAGGVFNDWFDASQDFNESASQVVGRVSWLPFLSEDDSALIHLGFGGRYSDAEEGVRYARTPEFNNSPNFVDTGFHQADSTMTYNIETSIRRGPTWLAAEYSRTNIKSSVLNDPTLDGYSLTMSWILTGEMREYTKRNGTMGPVPIAKSVYQGGWGAWETAIRWSNLDLTDGALEGGDMDILSLALNWYLSPIFIVNLNYRYITLDKPDQFGNNLKGNSQGINTRIVVLLP